MNNPITELNSFKDNISYSIERKEDNPDMFLCTVKLEKDNEVFDCEGVGFSKRDAKYAAAHQMVALLKLLFPMVPLALFKQRPVLDSEYQMVNKVPITNSWLVFHLYEIRNANIYVYVDMAVKRYCVLHTLLGDRKPLIKRCPTYLMNNPVRFTDWSEGVISFSQEQYVSERIKHILEKKT